MEKADWIVDLGPGAGTRGGEVVAAGTLNDIQEAPNSLTGRYLTGKLDLELSVITQSYPAASVLFAIKNLGLKPV